MAYFLSYNLQLPIKVNRGFHIFYTYPSLFLFQPSRENYQKVFLFAGGVAVVGGTFYNIFVTGVQQPWNDPSTSNKITPNNGCGGSKARDGSSLEPNDDGL